MPLTSKGETIRSAMEKEYGGKKGEAVFYASRNKGNIRGVDAIAYAKQRGDSVSVIGKEPPGYFMDKLDSVAARLDGLTKRLDARERKDAVRAVNTARNDTRFERDLQDNEPRIVSGVKGVKSKSFSKRFPNQAAMERWMDGEGGDGDYEVQEVRKAY